MTRRRIAGAVSCVIALWCAPSVASAQFTTYTSLSAYLAALSDARTDTFDDLPVGPVANPIARSISPYTYSGDVSAPQLGSNSFFNVGTPPDVWLGSVEPQQVITFSGFSSNVRGVGGFFFATNSNGDFYANVAITLSATNAGGTITSSIVSATPTTFYGFVSLNGPVTSLTVSVEQGADDPPYPTVNNVVLGAEATTVPEPASLALTAVGLLGIAAAVRHRRKRGNS